MYKIASSEVTNLELIRSIAETGKPAIISTGLSMEDDISMAVDEFKRNSNAELVLFHCVSLYPLEPGMANLTRIKSLRERFGIDVGFSDHSRGSKTMVMAAGLGTRIFEKHFTIDRNYDCPDKDVSMDPSEFAEMINLVENGIEMLGDGSISYGEDEAVVANAARRSLFAMREIPAGKVIEQEDLIALRPGVGIPANRISEVIGKTAGVNIKKDHLIRKEFYNKKGVVS